MTPHENVAAQKIPSQTFDTEPFFPRPSGDKGDKGDEGRGVALPPRLKRQAAFVDVSHICVGWIVALSVLACSPRHLPLGRHHPQERHESYRTSAGPLTQAQRGAVERLVDLCASAQISRLHISRDNSLIEHKTFHVRASETSDVMSVTKAVAGLLVGCLLKDPEISKRICLRDSATGFPPALQRVTAWEILHHTSGIRLDTDDEVGRVYRATDIIDIIKQARLVKGVARNVRYSNVAVNLINPLIAAYSGMSVESFAQERLFSPLGIPRRRWEGDGRGNQYIMAGLHLGIQDLAKIGGLLFSRGRYRGQQVVPERWIASLWEPSAVVHQDAIGGRVSWSNLWAQTYDAPPSLDDAGHPECPPDLVSASGFGGQFIVALRRSQLVIVTQKDMELNDSRPHLGGEDFGQSLDQLDAAFALTSAQQGCN